MNEHLDDIDYDNEDARQLAWDNLFERIYKEHEHDSEWLAEAMSDVFSREDAFGFKDAIYHYKMDCNLLFMRWFRERVAEEYKRHVQIETEKRMEGWKP